MMFSGGLLLSSNSMSFGAITVDIEGTPGSTLLNITVSGGGTWNGNYSSDRMGWGGGWDGDFLDDSVQNEPGISGGSQPVEGGNITINSNGTLFQLIEISFDSDTDSENGDDFALVFQSAINTTIGTPFTISGSVLFDLESIGPNFTFDDFKVGTYTAPAPVESSRPTTDITLNLVSVPEPSTAMLICGFSVFGLFRRNRS